MLVNKKYLKKETDNNLPSSVFVKVKGNVVELTEDSWNSQDIVTMLQDMGLSFTRAYGYGFYCADKACYKLLCQALKRDDKAKKAIEAGKPISKASLLKALDIVAYATNNMLKDGKAQIKIGESISQRYNLKRERGRKLEYVSDSIENVVDLLVAIEEYSGGRYTSSDLRSDVCYIFNQHHGGNPFYVRLEDGAKGDVLSCYYYNLDSVVDDCVEKAAEDLSDYSGRDVISAILESLSVNLEEAWTDDFDFYTQVAIPCSKQKLFKMFDEMSEAVHDYIIDLAEDNCSAVEDIIVNKYEEKRTRMETRYNRNVSRVRRRR